MEAAAQLVPQAAVGHGVQGPPRHRERPRVAGREVAAKEELDRHRLRELGRPPPTAVDRIE